MHRQNDEIQISTVDLRMAGENNEKEETTICLRTEGQNEEREISTIDQHDDQSQTSSTNTGEDGRNDEEDGPSTHTLPTRFQRLKQTVKRNPKLRKYTFLIIKELVDSILDWLLYYQLSSVEEGLVIGPVDAGTLGSLLLFCCLGTVLGVIDTSNRLYDLYTGSPFVDIAITETLVLYLEDIPQMMIGFIITSCRGGTEAKLALTLKVVVILVASIIILLLSTDRCIEKMNKTFVIHNVGTCVAFAIAFFTFNSFLARNTHGSFQDGVAVFVNTRHNPFHSGKITWIKLFDLDDFSRHRKITSRVITNPGHLRIQTLYGGMENNDSDICYRRNETHYIYYTKATNCTLKNGTAFHYIFIYLSPSERHPFGDIQYNVRETPADSCDNNPLSRVPRLRYFQGNTTEYLSGFMPKNERGDNLYSANATVNNVTGHVLRNETKYTDFYLDKYAFYNAENDLTEITDIWNTGVELVDFEFLKPFKCETTGSISPHFNPDIPVPCPL